MGAAGLGMRRAFALLLPATALVGCMRVQYISPYVRFKLL